MSRITRTGEDEGWLEYRGIIRDAMVNRPRSLQVRIGPSELGIGCLRCLARKLACIPEERGEDWLPQVGTAVHGDLGPMFASFGEGAGGVGPLLNATGLDAHGRHRGRPRFEVELAVTVGTILGTPITGHLDLYDYLRREVTDWKVVGVTTLRRVKSKGPAPEYRVQIHAYARGCVAAGLPVDRVRIAYLPRNEATLEGTRTVVEPYDERIVIAALNRAERIAERMLTNGVERTIAELPANEGDCYSCSRYPRPDGTFPLPPGHYERQPFRGLIPSTK